MWKCCMLLGLFMNVSFVTSELRSPGVVVASGSKFIPTTNNVSLSQLFEVVDEIRVTGPNEFPKPTDKIDKDAVPIVEPAFGKHRPEADAIFAYAEGYRLPYYMMFLETLAATGYTGDVVLAIAESRIIKPHVEEYLRSFSAFGDGALERPNVVVYQTPLECEGSLFGSSDRQLTKSGETDVFQMCRLSNVYGWKDATTRQVIRTAADPRHGRVVATLRYEWYWIWSLQYNTHSWLMLLDARDSFFQSNPFDNLPRKTQTTQTTQTDSSKGGLLYFFGENANATRLGKSTKNSKWILNGYGSATFEAVKDKPTICSGSTMGEQVAIETYLRAMVNEHDECDIRMTGSDQGFHNYLYYSGKLLEAISISKIIVWEQGRGIINNLGALRTRTLSQWGIHDNSTQLVYQWDGKTLSPVCHQFDRDKSLHSWMIYERHKQYEDQWTQYKQKQEEQTKQDR